MNSAARLIAWWARVKDKPGGKRIFDRMVAVAIPYTGAMGAHVLELRPGYARVQLRERRGIRNHLGSIHAIALANLGEFTGGLAMTATAPATVRSILLKLEVEFTKKARGVVTAECHCTVPAITAPTDHIVKTVVRDASDTEVARVAAVWRISPAS